MKDKLRDLFKTSWIAVDTLQGLTPPKEVFHAVFEPQDLRHRDLRTLTGIGFMKTVRSFFDKKKVEKVLRGGWKIADRDGTNHTHAHFEWEGDDLISSARPLTRLLCSLTYLSRNAEEPADRLGKHHPQLQSPGI